MPEYKLSYKDPDSGCIYCIDEDTGKVIRVCTISAEEIPESVRGLINADKERLAVLNKVIL